MGAGKTKKKNNKKNLKLFLLLTSNPILPTHTHHIHSMVQLWGVGGSVEEMVLGFIVCVCVCVCVCRQR